MDVMFGLRRPEKAASDIRHVLKGGAARLGRLGREEGGTVVVLAGIILPALVGGMGLGAEVGYWYFTQRELQHAADVSAYAAGVRKLQGEDDPDELEKVATYVAEESGFAPGTVELNTPYDGSHDKVEVILTETIPRLFTAFFLDGALSLAGRAVVEIDHGSPACVLALEDNNVGIEIGGTASLTMNGCDIASNSVSAESLKMHGSAALSTRCAHTVGQAVTTAKLDLDDPDGPCADGTPHEFSRKTVDPYADVLEPEDEGKCEAKNFKPNQVNVLTPYDQGHPSGLPTYRFCNGVQFKGEVVFGPGLYIFSGGTVSAESTGTLLTGTDVTFYLTNGASLDLRGNATVNLSARTEDPYAGILFFADREDTGIDHTVNGGAGGSFQGAVYFPGGDVTYAGGAGLGGGGCTQIIGRTVTFTGNSEVSADCTAAGTRDILANRGVRIIE